MLQGDLFSQQVAWDHAQAITVTGSRDADESVARKRMEIELAKWLGRGHTWLLGGARGVDAWATEWLLANDETCVAVVPFSLDQQPKSVQPLLRQLSMVVELDLPKRRNSYLVRNQYMVDRSSRVTAFWNGAAGGTKATIDYALKKRLEVHVYPLEAEYDDLQV